MKEYRVATVCMQDFGGAGRAAYRLHTGLLSIGVHSTMIVANKRSGDPSVKVIPPQHGEQVSAGWDVARRHSPAWEKQLLKWQDRLGRYEKRPAGLEFFSDAETDIRLDLVEEIRTADVLHLHWVGGVLDYPTAARLLASRPVVWTLHDMNPFTGGCHYAGTCTKYATACGACPQLGSDDPSDWARRIWRQKRRAYRQARFQVVTPSRWLARCARESALLGRFPAQVVPNSLPVDVFAPGPKAQTRALLHLDPEAKIVLFGAESVGNNRKGFPCLVEALRILGRKHPDMKVQLVLFGHPPEAMDLALPWPVRTCGPVEDELQLARIYSAADLFVLPSLEDNLPNTVVEALACGVPVVAFDTGGLPDLVDHGQNGYLAPCHDLAGFAEAIARVLRCPPEEAARFSQQARSGAVRRYSPEAQARTVAALYEQLLGGAPGPARGPEGP